MILFFLVNGVVLLNAVLHDPRIGYDALGHLQYASALADFRLPEANESREFFSPPLPYVVPAALLRIGGRFLYAFKTAQLVNVAFSVGLTFFLLKVCLLISESLSLRFGTLLALGVFPVYYKTFCFVRGEPYVAFFVAVSFYLALQVFVNRQQSLFRVLCLGVSLGFALLSRQWAVFFVAALVLFIVRGFYRNRRQFTLLLGSLLMAALVSSWFYALLHFRHGSVTAFNRESAAAFTLKNQPPEFYFGLGLGELFTNPIRPAFANQLLPTFYSDFWGDYWGFFVVYGFHQGRERYLPGNQVEEMVSRSDRPKALETNFDTIGRYLGRVNLVSLVPTLLLAIALVSVYLWRDNDRIQSQVLELSLLVIFISVGGYLWFLIMYPNPGKGDTIKASYLLHIYPLVALHFGCFLEKLQKRSIVAFGCTVMLLLSSAAYSSSAMLTRYSLLRLL
jgi:hypothetical protein